MPIISARPIIDIESIWNPKSRITMKVERIEVGIARNTTTALRQAWRKSSMTIAVKTMPSINDCPTPTSIFCV